MFTKLETQYKKDSSGSNYATTEYLLNDVSDNCILTVCTRKNTNGHLIINAHVSHVTHTGQGYKSSITRVFTDYSEKERHIGKVVCTAKKVRDEHLRYTESEVLIDELVAKVVKHQIAHPYKEGV